MGEDTEGQNFHLNVGTAPRQACSVTRNSGTNSAHALGPRKPTENLDELERIIAYTNSVRISKRTPYFTITEINWLMLFKEIFAV
jgi:hypothetical protein